MEIEDSHLDLILEHADLIIARSEHLEIALEEQLSAGEHLGRNDVIFAIESVFISHIEEEEAHELAHHILLLISTFDRETLKKLQVAGAPESLIDLITDLCVKFSRESKQPNYRTFQGREYWEKIQSDIVLRGWQNRPGLNHTIWKGTEPVELSVDFNSNIALVGNLLLSQIEALEELDEEAAETINLESVETLNKHIEELNEQVGYQPSEPDEVEDHSNNDEN